ncbi:MAG: response regulator transcription factor [Alphaproteobacteria bacterium]|nr:response regulator transcription factor [Alphaproteobacteria bacterium]
MRIVLADDHNLVRDGLKPFLRELAPEVEIVDASTFPEALAAVEGQPEPALVLLDLMMPGMDGVKGVETMRARLPKTPVVIVSGHVGREAVLSAMRAGASGFIPKTISGANLVNALRLVMAGETYLPASLLAADEPPAKLGLSPPLDTLSPREREILSYLVEGNPNKVIARHRDLQEITVKIHLRNVYRKIGAANRAQAVRIAMSAGFK